MQKELILNILNQNRLTNGFSFNKLTIENADLRLNEQAASVGFIYRHIGETINLFGTFFGVPTEVVNTTMGEADKGQGKHIEESRKLVEKGYAMLQKLVENTSDIEWLDTIETPFFGKVTRIRLFAHILFYNSHHAGQIALTLARGK